MIPYGRQDINNEDVDAVLEVLKSDFLTQGPVVPKFEREVADKVGALYGVAVNSATSALHVACLALGLSKGDYLWTTPITFVASANCGIYCGAKIDFVDIDLDTYNISIVALEKKLLLAKTTGTLPKILVVVHLCGQSCDMESLYKLSKRFGFKIIEDGSHAIGGKYINEDQINNWKLQLTNYEMGNVNLEIHNLQSKAIDEEELLNKILVDNDKKIMSISEERDLYKSELQNILRENKALDELNTRILTHFPAIKSLNYGQSFIEKNGIKDTNFVFVIKWNNDTLKNFQKSYVENFINTELATFYSNKNNVLIFNQ